MNRITDAQWTAAAATFAVFAATAMTVWFAEAAVAADLFTPLVFGVLLSLFVAGSIVVPSWVAPRERAR